jgi:MoxR-like ATPase
VTWGAGARAGQFLVLGAKARALLQGRAHVTVEDLRALAAPQVLRHRIILLNYRAEAEGVGWKIVIARLLEAVKSPTIGSAWHRASKLIVAADVRRL